MDDGLVSEITDLFLLHKAGGLDDAEFSDAKAAACRAAGTSEAALGAEAPHVSRSISEQDVAVSRNRGVKKGAMLKRVQKELQAVQSNPPPGIRVTLPDPSNVMHWTAWLDGPPDSPYKGGRFQLDIQIGDDYPMKSPKILYKTKIAHPNIHPDGRICLDILGGWDGKNTAAWSPAFRVDKVLLMLQAMMSAPNFDDPWVNIKAPEWPAKAAAATRQYAMA